jgi:thiamine-phosphate pyrophosphorylase
MLPVPPLLVISDRRQARRPLEAVAAAAFAGGCRWFSLREKDLEPAERRRLLASLVALAGTSGAIVGVHEDVAAALAVGAAAIHLPSGQPIAPVRARLPQALPRVLIGASAHSVAEAAALLRQGADYVTFSPIFVSASKPGYGPAQGLAGLAAAASAPGPVVALGGIDSGNAAACLAAGAAGIAVMGEIMRAPDPQAAVERLLEAMAASQGGSL